MKQEDLLKIVDWATGDDTGVSSEALCRFMLGLKLGHWSNSAPSDAADRGRCIRLLNLIPEWWDRLDEMSKIPSREVNIWSKKGLEVRNEGWKEQIPLIKQESVK